MDNSVVLLGSMSPKIVHKLNPGQQQFRRVSGASVLALKKNIRRSSLLDNSVKMMKKQNLNLIEESSIDSFPALQLEESIIVIEDSDSDSNCSKDKNSGFQDAKNTKIENDFNEEGNCLLPQEKFEAISNWVANLNKENLETNSIFSQYTDISSICNSEIGNNLLQKEVFTASNSTFVKGHNKKFNEMFEQRVNFDKKDLYKNTEKLETSIKELNDSQNITDDNKINDSIKNLEIDDSFEINLSLRSRLKQTKLSSDINADKKINPSKKSFNDKNESGSFKTKSNNSLYTDNKVIDDSFEITNDDNKLENNTNNNLNFKIPKNQTNSIKSTSSKTPRSKSNNSLYTDNNKVIDDSFEITNDNNKLESNTNNNLNFKIPKDQTNSIKSTSPKTPRNKWTAVEISDDSDFDGDYAETVLNELYGNSWRKKKDLILPRTEPKKKIVKRIEDIHSERKPKKSLLYKNPYLDTEKLKSESLLKSLQTSRLKETAKSPWLEKLKKLCDSDSSKENSPIIHKKLDFSESSDEECSEKENSTKSKYFKKINVNSKNVNTRRREPIPSSSSSNKSDGGDPYFTPYNKEIDLKNIQRKTNKASKPTSKKKIGVNIESSSSSSRRSIEDNLKQGKECLESLPRKAIASKETISVSSDEEWENEISRIERRLTISKKGTYSFLASLSGNIPLSKCDCSARIYRTTFKTNKDELLKKLYKLYNKEVFNNLLPHDMVIEWNDRMRKTAGYCYCRRIRKSEEVMRSARIVLSTKVIDSPDRLRDTLIHELCHAATWIINCVSDGHGHYWKGWASKAMRTFPELPPIQRCHNYTINTKYTYKCTGCGYSVGRHSKSLNIERKRCGYCFGKFEVFLNKTNKNGENRLVSATPRKEATGFALFVKENYSAYKSPAHKHGDVMKILGQKFKELQVNNK